MKKIILILAIILSCSIYSFAQDKGFTAAFNWNTATNKPFSNKYDFATQNFAVAPGYSFNGRLFARLPVSLTTELYQVSAEKTYEMNCYLGGTIGYDIVRNRNIGTIELAATVGGTVSDKPQYIYYDLGAMWYLGHIGKVGIGLGARYYQAQTTDLKSRMTMTFNIGFRFN